MTKVYILAAVNARERDRDSAVVSVTEGPGIICLVDISVSIVFLYDFVSYFIIKFIPKFILNLI